MTKQFVFLYPIPEFINSEIEQGMCFLDSNKETEFAQKLKKAKSEDEKTSIRQLALQDLRLKFRTTYRTQLNACIDLRYRQNGFAINYAVYDGSPLSDVVEFQRSDRVIEVGLDFRTHTTKQPNGEYPYPDPNYLLSQLGEVSVIRIAGFHMWDCVEQFAKKAYEIGLDTLVDEDLTEFFKGVIRDPGFKIGEYPSYNPRKHLGSMFDRFMEVRRERPWLWQEY